MRRIRHLDGDRTWFTSDTHFGHENIIRHCNRPFKDRHEMNAKMLAELGAAVQPGDTLIHLGDVSMPRKQPMMIETLRGSPLADPAVQRILLRGNHDANSIELVKAWHVAENYLEISLEGFRIVLCHYPFASWNRMHRGSLHFHGHCHGNVAPKVTEQGGRLDAGVDCWDYKPFRLRDALNRLEELRNGQ